MLSRINSALSVATIAVISACAAPTPSPEQPEILRQALPTTTDVAGSWSTTIERGIVVDGWLASFNDARLEAIVTEALANNRSLAVAAANLEASSSLAKQAGAQLAPVVNVGAGGESVTRGDNNRNTSGATLSAQWELDVWGRLRAGANAADESFRATAADFEFGRQSLAAQTAKAWFLATEAKL